MKLRRGNIPIDAAIFLGVLISTAILDSSRLSRPFVSLLGPPALLACLYLLAPSLPRDRWRRLIWFAAIASGLGYVLTRYFFVHQ